MGTLELAYKPDAEQSLKRMEAWWRREILDRPTIQVTAPRPNPRPVPQKRHATYRDRWLDVEYVVELADANIANTYWGGEVLPNFFPNLGPEVLTAMLGADLNFGADTSWSEPMLHDWADIPKLKFDPESEMARAMVELTKLSLEVGKGKFLTSITDLHPGGDLAASLRDPQQLCIDIASEPEQVAQLMDQLRPCFFQAYEMQEKWIKAAGQTVAISWLPLFTEGRYYIPSNDFSIMISPRQFERFFIPHLEAEIAWLDHSIYHLDGVGAVRHLDRMLAIEKLDAIQFVYGAGHEPASQWMEIYQRIQKAGKGMHITMEANELDVFMENLRPEGVMLQMWAGSVEEAESLIARVKRWK